MDAGTACASRQAVLKCIFVSTGDVMRLRAERPLRLAKVRDLLCGTFGPVAATKYQDSDGEPRVLTARALRDFERAQGARQLPTLRLFLTMAGPFSPAALFPGASRQPARVEDALLAEGAPAAAAGAFPPASGSEAPYGALVARAKEQVAALVRGQRRGQREQQLSPPLEASAAAQERAEEGTEAVEAVEVDRMGQPEVQHAANDEEDSTLVSVRARDLCNGMRLWIEHGASRRCLKASEGGRVEFDGGLEAASRFVVRRVSVRPGETVVLLQGPGGGYLRCSDEGGLDARGQGADEAGCKLSFADVVDGVVLFLGPFGTGHVLVDPHKKAPLVTRTAAPQGFWLFTCS